MRSVMSNNTRRAKTETPEVEKDERYWDKRKRNNTAAKKSRENKRQFDYSVKERIFELENENCMLRKELGLMKLQFGMSERQSMFTSEHKAELFMLKGRQKQSSPFALDCVMPKLHVEQMIKDQLAREHLGVRSNTIDLIEKGVQGMGVPEAQSPTHVYTPWTLRPDEAVGILSLVNNGFVMQQSDMTRRSGDSYAKYGSEDQEENYEATDISVKSEKLTAPYSEATYCQLDTEHADNMGTTDKNDNGNRKGVHGASINYWMDFKRSTSN